MEDVSVFALMVRLVVSLGVVLVLMAFAGRLLARQAPGRRVARSTRPVPIQILARQSLSKGSSVAVVQAGDKALIVGVTDSQVTLLGASDITLEAEEHDEADPATTITAAAGTRSPWATPRSSGAAAFSPWTAMLDTLRERTVRRS